MQHEEGDSIAKPNDRRETRTNERRRGFWLLPAVLAVCLVMLLAGTVGAAALPRAAAPSPALPPPNFECSYIDLTVTPGDAYTSQSVIFTYNVANNEMYSVVVDAFDLSYSWGPSGDWSPYTLIDWDASSSYYNTTTTPVVPGDYSVSIAAEFYDEGTYTYNWCDQTNVFDFQPVPILTITDSSPSGTAPLSEQFTASVTGGFTPYFFSWNFGDGTSTSDLQDPAHTYSYAGTYTATLSFADDLTATASLTLTIVVAASTPSLTATASASPTSGAAPLTVTFTGSASGGVAPYSYSWSFGDGWTGTGATVQHTYSTAGTYTASLTVTDSASPVDIYTTNAPAVTVSTASSSLTASATGSPTRGTAPLEVTFSGSATGGTAPYTYAWTFGDGFTGSGETVYHTYSAVGTYTATLTVTDSAGHTAVSTVTITVTSSPGGGGGGGGGGTTTTSGVSPWVWVGAAAGVVVVALAVYLVVHGRRKPAPAAPPAA